MAESSLPQSAATQNPQKAAAHYSKMSSHRTTVLQRARDASALTIPGLIPWEGQNEHWVSAQPYQSVGARCVANLSSRLLLALFPPNVPFFRLEIARDIAKQLGTSLGDANDKLSVIGDTAYDMMEENVIRPVMNEALRHLIVAGNVLLYQPDGEQPRLYRLDQYVVRRDYRGQFAKIVVHECVHPDALTDEVRVACKIKDGDHNQKIDMYTVVSRTGDNVEHWQEINDTEVPGTRGQAPYAKCGWFPLRWLAVPGSDYGRSHVTEYIGDFLSLEDLSKSMVKFAAVASHIVHLVDPNSGVNIEDLAAAESGDYLHGIRDRIQTLQLDKAQDWQVINALASSLEGRLSNAFLLRSNAIRNAERVTAEEVRMVAEELETVLGGTYSILAAEMQLPLVRRYLHLGAKKKRFPALPTTVQPIITTGFDALGRAAGVNRLKLFVTDLTQMLGPQVVQAIIDPTELAKRVGNGYSVEDLDSLVKDQGQQQQDQQQAASQQVAAAATPELVKAAAPALVSHMGMGAPPQPTQAPQQ